jgi:microcystin-dependent protein
MSTPYISEIRLMSFNFPPKGWAFCNGQVLSIQQNQVLFALLGTTYGGNGTTTFALPNLQGLVPIHFSNGYALGSTGGAQSHTLTVAEMPAHVHATNASTNAAGSSSPSGTLLARPTADIYAPVTSNQDLVPLASTTLGSAGGSQAHSNQQPYLTLSFCIALQGIFPTRN